MGYENFSVEDFAADHDFVRWVRNPDAPGNLFWRQWMAKHPHKRADIDRARFLVLAVDFPQPAHAENRREAVWKRIIHTNRMAHKQAFRPARPAPRKIYGWKAAAIITGFLLVTLLPLYTLRQQPAVYATNFGETQTIELPDGSTVVLNANSALRLGASWENNREVWLEGEAFFSVQKKTMPGGQGGRVKFTVHTNTVDVNVLGTEFTVAERSGTRIVLNSGAIVLTWPHASQKMIRMQPGEMVEITRGERKLVQSEVNPKVYSAWKDHVWILDGLSLDQVAGRITETFGVPVAIGKDVDAGRQVSGVVPTDNLDTVLEALSAVFGRRFVRQHNRIVIE